MQDKSVNTSVSGVAKNSESQIAVNFIRSRGRQPKSSEIFRQAKIHPNV